MAQATWEKGAAATSTRLPQTGARGGRLKFMVGGLIILAAMIYLVVSGTMAGAQYFLTVDSIVNDPSYVGKTVRISGVVLGDTIDYDAETLTINFTIANIPSEYEDLATALHEAANNTGATRLAVRVENQVKPDLLQHEAQAILSGHIDENGVFQASELLLKCPSRFVEGGPDGEALQAET
jgi:cytochrome c-type biogenesis protein CcmE